MWLVIVEMVGKLLRLLLMHRMESRLTPAEMSTLVNIVATACARSPRQRVSSPRMQALVHLVIVAMEELQLVRACTIQLGSIWTLQVSNTTYLLPFPSASYSLCSFLDNLYLADCNNHRVRKVLASTSVISTIAGDGSASYSGDNGQATSAALYHPVGVVVDTSGKGKYLGSLTL